MSTSVKMVVGVDASDTTHEQQVSFYFVHKQFIILLIPSILYSKELTIAFETYLDSENI